MTHEHFDCLIVGGGHAGAEAAITLRATGFAGSIGLLGNEAVHPYERPALSKEYLAGKKSLDQLLLRPTEYWAEHDVDLRLSVHVVGVDTDNKTVTCDDGTMVGYGSLVWAAGGSPRRLDCPGHDLNGIHAIRDMADCDRLMSALPQSRRIAVIGGGFIGLEAAAVLRELGKEVAIIEALDRFLARVAAEPVSRFYENEHRDRGVSVHLGTGVAEILGHDGEVTGVRLTDGTVIDADQVIVGIGIIPAIQPLLTAGAEATAGSTGVLIDDHCRTSLPDVYCVGDCAVLREGPGIRIESRQNAIEQAQTAAKAISGQAEALNMVPWFWSNQYDLRLKTIGLSLGYDQTVLRGDPESRSFSLIYLKRGAVIAMDCINATRDYMQGRRLVETGAHVDAAILADAQTPLKEVAAAI
ncbi:FAD-dependent oxidoreductase [Arthrobacter bambusae]|uniref:NAD(P)/FAD-dependent oxidoreductase n=1 Tax=Arthrobacter bambusae TaxID=1338426 RepID=UPI001F511D0A|nr:FAD-dependent oxidoreductase [Arthrobacter bambusae]MCI0142654.1 FAD-dependent oxidoreductase [Arthrobacter bambusae]